MTSLNPKGTDMTNVYQNHQVLNLQGTELPVPLEINFKICHTHKYRYMLTDIERFSNMTFILIDFEKSIRLTTETFQKIHLLWAK